MKTLERLSKKAKEWCEFMGYDIDKVKENMESDSFAVEVLNKEEAEDEGCDMNYPYRLYNPFNFNIK